MSRSRMDQPELPKPFISLFGCKGVFFLVISHKNFSLMASQNAIGAKLNQTLILNNLQLQWSPTKRGQFGVFGDVPIDPVQRRPEPFP